MLHNIRLLTLVVALLFSLSCTHRERGVSEPMSIEVAVATTEKIPNRREFIGPLSANYSATIQPRVASFLATSSFENGMPVRQGQLIFTLDDSQQRASRLAAEATLSSSQAKAVEAKRNYERAVPLARINAISQTQLDQYTAENKAAIAAVKSANQTLRNAVLDESYTRIYAPISGVISSSSAHIGDYVGPGTQFSTLTTIQSIDTMSIDISIPMSQYLAYSGRTSFSYENASLLKDIELRLADGTLYGEPGFYKFTRQSISDAMGAIVIVVGFRNPDYALKSGQFGRVTATLGGERDCVLVPQRAINQIQDISSVWVIRPDSTAEYRRVRLGATYGTSWIVDEGIAAGEVVATTGLQKLRDGVKVSITHK